MTLERVLQWAGLPAGALAMIALWSALDIPKPAWSTDISRLSLKQAELAVELYGQKIRGLLTTPAFSDPNSPSARAWEEELRRTREQLQAAEQRKIEMAK